MRYVKNITAKNFSRLSMVIVFPKFFLTLSVIDDWLSIALNCDIISEKFFRGRSEVVVSLRPIDEPIDLPPAMATVFVVRRRPCVDRMGVRSEPTQKIISREHHGTNIESRGSSVRSSADRSIAIPRIALDDEDAR